MMSETEGRLAVILKRELGAATVRFERGGEEPAASETRLTCAAPGGTVVVAEFDEAPADREARARRMEMIVASFADLLTDEAASSPGRPKHPAPARSLAGELTALAGRSGALCALVVDARSPVVWGASDVEDTLELGAEETEGARINRRAALSGLRFTALVSEPLLDIEAHDEPALSGEIVDEHTADGEKALAETGEVAALAAEERAEFWRRVLLVRNALGAVRALPHVANLHKGEHLHESVRAPELSYVVRSFATIYMLLLVFDRQFDELRAERSIGHALPTIERLVLALPPTEPTPPMAGVGVMRAPRRR